MLRRIGSQARTMTANLEEPEAASFALESSKAPKLQTFEGWKL